MSDSRKSAAVRQLVFIDGRVPDRFTLMAGLEGDARAWQLDAERDALEQIADGLAQHGAVEVVHIVVHGSPGELHFASGTVSRAGLIRRSATLERIGAALAADGNLLLWACEVGRGRTGEAFLDALALATRVNVAAATHPIGSLARGGSWALDAATGPATMCAPFTIDAQAHYAGLLAAPQLNNVATAASYIEKAGATVLSPTLTVTDADSTNLASATVRISSGLWFGDGLTADTNGTLITATYNAANGILALTGSDTLAHYQQVLRTVAFSSTSDNPTDASLYPSRTIDWQVNDGSASSVAFQTHMEYPAGAGPQDVAIGDFNGDGKLDLATANFDSANVTALLGNGDGTFGFATSISVGSTPFAVATGDFNGDGKLDLATANADSDNVSVLLGNGNGTFGIAANFPVGNTPFSVAIGDLNGDGKLDLATANANASTVTVLFGNGDGTFGGATDFTVGTGPFSVSIGDLNGDGKLDLATANFNGKSVTVLLGNGNSTFARHDVAVGGFPQSVKIGDLNGDGKLDLATANQNDTVSVLLGNGDGTFGGPANLPVAGQPISVAIGELNGDGRRDLAIANFNDGSVSVLLGNGNGTFGTPIKLTVGSNPESVAIGDLNGAGGLDLATANFSSNDVSVLLNSGTNMSTLQHTAVAVTAVNAAPVLAGGDTATVSIPENRTAVTTVVATDPDSPTITYSIAGGSDAVQFQINSLTGVLSFKSAPNFEQPTDSDHNNSYIVTVRASDGSLTDDQAITVNVTDVPETAHWMQSVNIGAHPPGWLPSGFGDVNADGTSDVFWYNASTGGAESWMIQNGQWAGSVGLGTHPGSYNLGGNGDFNHDGMSDVLWFNPATNATDIWLLNNGQWAGSTSLGAHPAGFQAAGIGDFNHDGTSDVLWFNPSNNATDIWAVNNGQWAGSTSLGNHPVGYQVAGIGDFNHDGTSDVLWFNPSTGATDIWLVNNGQWAGSTSIGAHPAGWVPIATGDLNQDGTSDAVWYNSSTNNVEVWLVNNGQWAGSVNLGSHPAGSQLMGIGDFDHNGVSDLMWRDTSNGSIETWLMAYS